MSTPEYEFYAIKYGAVDVPAHYATMLDDPNDPTSMEGKELVYFFHLIRGNGRNILVDCGFDHECGAKRGRKIDRLPHEAIAKLGLKPEDIDTVILTHLHYDHAGTLGMWPNAEFVIQEKELAFATSSYMRHPAVRRAFDAEHIADMIHLTFAERVRFMDGDGEIAPGITGHLLPGHSHGLMGLQVNTRRGRVFLAGDVAHFYDNMWKRNPFSILQLIPEYCESQDKVLRMAESPDHIVPGHDRQILEIYPAHPNDEGIVDLTVQPSRSMGPA